MRPLGLVAGLVAVVAGLVGCGGSSEALQPEVVSNVASSFDESTERHLACTGADEPANFRLFSLGEEFEGHRLTAVLRECGPVHPDEMDGMSWRGNSVSYIYGECDPPDGEGGCAAPVEVQVWPSCERNHGDYGRNRPRLETRRGVSTARVDRGTEIYAESTVVIFAADRRLADRAVAAVQPSPRGAIPNALPPEIQPAARLPRPSSGALEARMSCRGR